MARFGEGAGGMKRDVNITLEVGGIVIAVMMIGAGTILILDRIIRSIFA